MTTIIGPRPSLIAAGGFRQNGLHVFRTEKTNVRSTGPIQSVTERSAASLYHRHRHIIIRNRLRVRIKRA